MPSRKPLRLPEYEYNTPGAYFVTVCTKERTPVLGTIVGAGDHTGPYPQSSPTGRNIATTVRSWKTLITKELGESIWQRSYYEHVIRNETDYWEIVKYIEQNPAKWYYRRGR